ncbi:MAG TPA: hypothetical protein P5102_12935 [Candidatus Competibacteraceae bacterium]|nr:hypothetical protein [Candidatus Competibacteraceae bacterium]HRZ07027.1 hypothetical protein [Candidatus Competibacteraceae bacterium]HSA47033.1 hypothetical protein [Candidatus Competibacteraceae bacterium]
MPFADNQKLRQALIAAYEDRPPLERGVLQLISIIYEGVSKTVLFDYIRRCEIPAFKGLSLKFVQVLSPVTFSNIRRGC